MDYNKMLEEIENKKRQSRRLAKKAIVCFFAAAIVMLLIGGCLLIWDGGWFEGEIPPTYGLYGKVIGLMAGGDSAIINPAEDAEDDPGSIAGMMREKYGYCGKDILVAISASGSANCVKGALAFAKEAGTKTICITCNKNSDLIPLSDLAIAAEVGPEVINGSTRMKAGTAQKMILNMLSTGAMVRYGRVRGNYMAYMIPSNRKLVARAIRMICQKTGCTPERAEEALEKANNIIADAMDAIEAES